MTTESSVLVLDHRFGSRPLMVTPHQLGPQHYFTSIGTQGKEWLFFEPKSHSDGHGGVMGLNWISQPYTARPSSSCYNVATVHAQPVVRKTAHSTLRHLQVIESSE